MIGQIQVLSQIDSLIEKGFPRFVIITGQKGQGKTELAIEISKRMKVPFCNFGITLDEIREMIQMAYKQTEPIIYLIQNADKMSIGAKNSLLKVIEEPPNNAYFIIELQQIENTLETIKSRCQEIKMEEYSEAEIEEMINKIIAISDCNERRILSQSARNYYQIETVSKYGVREFCDYVDKVYNNIYKVQSANSFKIAEKLDLKDTGEGYDLEIFWNMYIYRTYEGLLKCYMIGEHHTDLTNTLCQCIIITEKYKQKLSITGINKQSLVDMWILAIRKEWKNI